jgi:glucose-6-phosphate 1-dehydrogenase
LIVIMGGTGDLSRRKLLPALARLAVAGSLPQHCHIVGVSRDTSHDDASFRKLAKEVMIGGGMEAEQVASLCDTQLHFQTIGNEAADAFSSLKERLEQIERENRLPGNRVIYLALPTGAVDNTIHRLGEVNLNQSQGWTRIVVEKPFGYDLSSAESLVSLVHDYFEENQVYRIDHYLGKETVQNLLAFRFANPIFESLWNRDRIESVQITVAEDVGVGTRADYYDRAGAMRDMVQNHLMQLLTLIAMEVPPVIGADSVRYEKIKVLRSTVPIANDKVVFGQYAAGHVRDRPLPGYLDEEGVPKDSLTETFVALKMEIANWRWQGVPFYLRTGKRLPRRFTRIGVRFRRAPVCMFENEGACAVSSNLIFLTLQPDEGFSLYMDVKTPGAATQLRQIPLAFKYSDTFDAMPEAYETLLLDVLEGDQTLFVHSDEVLASWRLFDPLLTRERTVFPYPAGSTGPKQAEYLAIPERELFENS